MSDIFERFWVWYSAPWQRIDRKDFGIALLVVSLPSLISVFLMAKSAGGYIGPLMDMAAAAKGISGGGDMGGGLEALQQATGALPGGEAASGFDGLGVVNNLLFLALFPICRMRLRDMGYTGRNELGWAVAMHVSVVGSLIYSATGYDVLPWGWLWALLNFGGYMWISLARGQPRLAVHARMDYTQAQIKESETDDR